MHRNLRSCLYYKLLSAACTSFSLTPTTFALYYRQLLKKMKKNLNIDLFHPSSTATFRHLARSACHLNIPCGRVAINFQLTTRYYEFFIWIDLVSIVNLHWNYYTYLYCITIIILHYYELLWYIILYLFQLCHFCLFERRACTTNFVNLNSHH